MLYKKERRTLLSILLGLWLCFFQTAYSEPLTLLQAEKAAVSQSPEVKSLQAKAEALDQSATAAGQLSDPKLMFGTMNVPVDTFDFSQEPMTQIQVGLMQAFPRGHSLYYRSLREKELSQSESQKSQLMRLHVLQGVRLSWLDLYYWLNAKGIVLKQKQVFQHLVNVTESMLANNKAQQKDVLRSQLALTELENRLLNINQQINTARATLARWIGIARSKTAHPIQLPRWRPPPAPAQFQDIIKQHPILKTDASLIASRQAAVQLARQQYKPGFSAGVAYGFRQGRNIDGSRRANFLSAQVSMDLPLFTHNRQNRTLRASEASLLATKENQMSHYREILGAVKIQYVAWQQQRQSASLYRSRLVPEAKQYAEATMIAYQNAQTDFPTLARAYVGELNTELAGLKARVAQDKARVNLLYLQGK